eukprot:423127_1
MKQQKNSVSIKFDINGCLDINEIFLKDDSSSGTRILYKIVLLRKINSSDIDYYVHAADPRLPAYDNNRSTENEEKKSNINDNSNQSQDQTQELQSGIGTHEKIFEPTFSFGPGNRGTFGTTCYYQHYSIDFEYDKKTHETESNEELQFEDKYNKLVINNQHNVNVNAPDTDERKDEKIVRELFTMSLNPSMTDVLPANASALERPSMNNDNNKNNDNQIDVKSESQIQATKTQTAMNDDNNINNTISIKSEPSARISGKCSWCSRDGVTNRCGKCKAVYYCNLLCQQNHWKTHEAQCNHAKIKDEISNEPPKSASISNVQSRQSSDRNQCNNYNNNNDNQISTESVIISSSPLNVQSKGSPNNKNSNNNSQDLQISVKQEVHQIPPYQQSSNDNPYLGPGIKEAIKEYEPNLCKQFEKRYNPNRGMNDNDNTNNNNNKMSNTAQNQYNNYNNNNALEMNFNNKS